MDIDSLVAIDVHTHVHRSVNAPKTNPEDNEHLAAMAAYFKTAAASFTVDDLAARCIDQQRTRLHEGKRLRIDESARGL